MKVNLLGDGPSPAAHLVDEKIDPEPRHQTKFFKSKPLPTLAVITGFVLF